MLLERIKAIIEKEDLSRYCTAVFQYGDKVKLIPVSHETLMDGCIYYSNGELWKDEDLRQSLIENLKTRYFIMRNY